MGAFKVGDVAIISFIGNPEASHMHNTECEIVEFVDDGIHQYIVRCCDGDLWLAHRIQLRRRPPKSNDTEWANEKLKDLLKVKPEGVTV